MDATYSSSDFSAINKEDDFSFMNDFSFSRTYQSCKSYCIMNEYLFFLRLQFPLKVSKGHH
jgi:hypothetical protein